MLKERRNQGTIAFLVISLIFLAVAAVMGFIQYQKVNTETAYDRNSEPGADSAVYAEVSYIFPEALIEVDDNTQVWLVAYQDGYVGLQAKKGDKQIAKLLEKEKKGELEKNPVRIVGSYVNANSPKKNQGYISNYGSLVRGLLADNPEVITVMSSSSYISITEFESDNLAFMFYILFLIGLCVFFVVMGIIGRKKNIAAYEEIYAAYPEAKDNLNILLEQASFHDDVLKIAVYKDHLITYYRGFKAIDLKQVVHLYHHILTMHRGFVASNRNSTLVAVRNNQKKYQMPIKNIGKTTDTKLQSTFDYLYNHFPHIRLGV